MCGFELDFEFKSKFAFEFLLTLERAFKAVKFSQVPHSEPQMGLKMTLRETRMGDLWGKFPQVSHSPPEGNLSFIEPPHFCCHGLCF